MRILILKKKFWKLKIIEDYGGTGRDFAMSIAIAEQIGAVDCGSIPMSVMVQSDMSTPALAQFGEFYKTYTVT